MNNYRKGALPLMDSYKIHLSEAEMPQEWYNIIPDLPSPMPPYLHPGTGEPITPADLAAIFPPALIEQEVSPERWIPIPDEVLRIYQLWRPSPLHRAYNLEKALKTPARIYYKNESVSPAGSHKPNTAVAQAYYNKAAGIKRLATETGAGQWGCALSLACNFFAMECTVYMVKVSYHQKPYRRSLMHIWGASVYPSPTDRTQAGRNILAADPGDLRQPGHGHLRGGGGRRHPRGHQLCPGKRPQPRHAAPDHRGAGDQKAVGPGRGVAGRAHRLCRRRQQFRRDSASRLCRTSSRAPTSASWRWSPLPAPP